jgi:hypothetical protein
MLRGLTFGLCLLVAGLLCLPSRAQLTLTGVGSFGGAAGGGCSQATAFLARTSGLSANYQTQYTTMICGLVTDGVWAKLDAFYVFKTSSEANALLSLPSATFNATKNGTPTFTANVGLTPTGTNTDYYSTNLNSSVAGGLAMQDSIHFSVWDGTGAGGDSNSQIAACSTQHLYTDFGGSAYFRITTSGGAGIDVATANAVGFYIGNRSGAMTTQGYKNGSSIVTSTTDTSTPLCNQTWTFPGTSVSGVTASTDLLLGGSIGGSLSSTDASNFYSRFNTYITSVP